MIPNECGLIHVMHRDVPVRDVPCVATMSVWIWICQRANGPTVEPSG